MNISRPGPFTRLSPLSRPPQAGPGGAPEPPEPNGDRASISTRAKLGAGIMLGLTVVGVVGGLAGCSPTPPQAQVQLQGVPSQTWMSTSDEVELGKQASQKLEKEFKVWINPQAQARLESIGQRLAQTSSRPDIQFKFKMLDSDMVNAMALPGGGVYATRALMQKFPDDDQLAFVLGHEIAHVEQRHSVDKLTQWAMRKVVTLPLHFRQWPISKMALDAGDELVGNRYGQAAESEADRLGQQHIVRMGISPYKAVEAMEHLRSLHTGKDIPVKIEQIISDHPPTQQRIQALNQWAAQSAKP